MSVPGYNTPAWSNGSSPDINAANLLDMGNAIELAEHPYGECSTAASTVAKTVTININGTLTLFDGLRVSVFFQNGNTASQPTLNVNSTGAFPISSYSASWATTWQAGQVISFVYHRLSLSAGYWMFDGIDAFAKPETLSNTTKSNFNVSLGSTPTNPDSALQMLLSYSAKIAKGVYSGNGTYGSANPNTLTFNFAPVLVIVCVRALGILPSPYAGSWNNSFIWTLGQENVSVNNSSCAFTQSGKSLSWYSNSGASEQLNSTQYVYQYIALGV